MKSLRVMLDFSLRFSPGLTVIVSILLFQFRLLSFKYSLPASS
jgi:hypothetical protein